MSAKPSPSESFIPELFEISVTIVDEINVDVLVFISRLFNAVLKSDRLIPETALPM